MGDANGGGFDENLIGFMDVWLDSIRINRKKVFFSKDYELRVYSNSQSMHTLPVKSTGVDQSLAKDISLPIKSLSARICFELVKGRGEAKRCVARGSKSLSTLTNTENIDAFLEIDGPFDRQIQTEWQTSSVRIHAFGLPNVDSAVVTFSCQLKTKLTYLSLINMISKTIRPEASEVRNGSNNHNANNTVSLFKHKVETLFKEEEEAAEEAREEEEEKMDGVLTSEPDESEKLARLRYRASRKETASEILAGQYHRLLTEETKTIDLPEAFTQEALETDDQWARKMRAYKSKLNQLKEGNNLQMFDDITCSICLDFFNLPVSLACGHTYCQDCITVYRQRSSLCPLCKADMSNLGNYKPNKIIEQIIERLTGETVKEDLTKKIEFIEQNLEHERLQMFHLVKDRRDNLRQQLVEVLAQCLNYNATITPGGDTAKGSTLQVPSRRSVGDTPLQKGKTIFNDQMHRAYIRSLIMAGQELEGEMKGFEQEAKDHKQTRYSSPFKKKKPLRF